MKKLFLLFALSCALLVLYFSDQTTVEQKIVQPSIHVAQVKPNQPTQSVQKPETYYGIDLSHYQGDLLQNIGRHNNLHFIIAKATQGERYVDPEFHYNWREIKKHGLIRGAYHFYVTSVPPQSQVEHFYDVVGDLQKSELPPVVDIESGSLKGKITPAKLQADLIEFLKGAEQKFGRPPMIYTSYDFAQEYLKNPVFNQYPLWLAEYTQAAQPKIPETWGKAGYRIWQKADSHDINSTETDFDEFTGLQSDLVK